MSNTNHQYCFAYKPVHNDGECCWCDYLHQLFDEGYRMVKDKDDNLYDREGEPVEIDDVQRISLFCFKCEKPIEDNFAMLIGQMEERSSDHVSERTTVELCETCYHAIMRFCGSTED